MTHPRIPWYSLAAVLTVAGGLAPAPLNAQVAAGVARPARLEVTTAEATARSEFIAGVNDIANQFFSRGTTRLKHAVDLDPTFGLARVMHATAAAGLTTTQREEEIARGVADAAKGTPGELLIAMAYRENFRQNIIGARAILLSAGILLPDEPMIAHQRALLVPALTGGVPTDAIVALKDVVTRFPDYAPTYNTLAYAQWTAGAKADALKTATTYMQKAGGEPKPHDTYAELLQWDGNFDGAIPHYRRAIEIDPTFLAGAYGLSEVYLLQGKGDLSRATLTAALPNATTPAQRISIFNRIANTYVMEGNFKAGLTALGTVLTEAQQSNTAGAIVGAHVAMMNVEAAFGDPKAVAAHVAHLAALPPPGPEVMPNPAARFVNQGTVHAVAGHSTQARIFLDSLTAFAATTPSETATAQTSQLTGWVLFSEMKYVEALAAFRQANQQNATVRSGIALTQFKLGNVSEARSLRDELVNDRNINLANGANISARRLVKQRIM